MKIENFLQFLGMNADQIRHIAEQDDRWIMEYHNDAQGHTICMSVFDTDRNADYDLYFGGYGEGHFDEPLTFFELV